MRTLLILAGLSLGSIAGGIQLRAALDASEATLGCLIGGSDCGNDFWHFLWLFRRVLVVEANLQVKISAGVSLRQTPKRGSGANRAHGCGVEFLLSRARHDCHEFIGQ